jgi:hypothetical protein
MGESRCPWVRWSKRHAPLGEKKWEKGVQFIVYGFLSVFLSYIPSPFRLTMSTFYPIFLMVFTHFSFQLLSALGSKQ